MSKKYMLGYIELDINKDTMSLSKVPLDVLQKTNLISEVRKNNSSIKSHIETFDKPLEYHTFPTFNRGIKYIPEMHYYADNVEIYDVDELLEVLVNYEKHLEFYQPYNSRFADTTLEKDSVLKAVIEVESKTQQYIKQDI